MRGTRHASSDGQARHLPAVAGQQASMVLAQAEVDGKTNEITCFAPLPAPLDLAGAVVTADAMHARREHAQFLVTEKNAHYILAVQNNQPGLYAQLASLPWHQVPAGFDAREKGHGRAEWRALKVTAIAAGIAFPHAAQAIEIKRRRKPLTSTKRWSAETSYAVTSLAAHQAAPAQLAAWVRGHRRIEALHYVRDVTYGEDASQTHTGNGPQVMAALQPRDRHPQTRRSRQHRRRLPLPCPRRQPRPDHPRTRISRTENGHHSTMPRPWGPSAPTWR